MPTEPKSRASRAVVADRVAEVLRIRLDGASFFDVCAYAKEKGWSVSERQCGRYLERADELLAAAQTKKRSRNINMHLARCETLYARAVNAADHRTALAILIELAKTQKVYDPEPEANGSTHGPMPTLQEFKEIARQAIMGLPLPPTGPPYLPPPPDDGADDGAE